VANVICRPELHGSPTREQYNEFHAGMKEFCLERTITRDGKVFHLPTGEYLGINISTSMRVLDLKITALAIRITGSRCKLTLTPVLDVSTIYISGLEEDTSYESTLGAFAGLGSLFLTPPPQPTYSGFSALAILAGEKVPQPTGIPDSLAFGFLTGMKR
jgi:hypothetical protein